LIVYSIRENNRYSVPDSIIVAGSVSTQASAMLRMVDHCSPDPLAAMVPAMPDESTCVVETRQSVTIGCRDGRSGVAA
jgi:hypothetical protein